MVQDCDLLTRWRQQGECEGKELGASVGKAAPTELVVRCLYSMQEALGSIPSTRKGREGQQGGSPGKCACFHTRASQVSVPAFTHMLLALA